MARVAWAAKAGTPPRTPSGGVQTPPEPTSMAREAMPWPVARTVRGRGRVPPERPGPASRSGIYAADSEPFEA
jgi:hypothetical protein